MDEWFESIDKMLQDLLKLKESYETTKAKVKEELQEEKNQLHQEKEEWKAQQKELQKFHFGPQDKVQLDVGGKIFTTSVQTLTNIPHSMLGAMFSGKHTVDKDSQGRYFIDRDGDLFGYILEFLRDGEVVFDTNDKILKAKLLKEAKYYALDELIVFLGGQPQGQSTSTSPNDNWCLDESCKNAMLTISGASKLTVTHGNSDGHASVRGTVGFNNGIHKWKVSIDSLDTNSYWIAIGVIEKHLLTSDLACDFQQWYGCSSVSQLQKSTGTITNWQIGQEFICTLDMNNCTFTIVGPGTNVTSSFASGITLFPIFNLFRNGNQISITIL